jgi:hypothetical protein
MLVLLEFRIFVVLAFRPYQPISSCFRLNFTSVPRSIDLKVIAELFTFQSCLIRYHLTRHEACVRLVEEHSFLGLLDKPSFQ